MDTNLPHNSGPSEADRAGSGTSDRGASTVTFEASTIDPACGTRTAAAGDDSPIGKVLGDYELLDKLGSGGMGVVYRARQRSANRIVALKLIRPERLADLEPEKRQQWLNRFQAEAQATARLEHEHIVTVYEVGSIDVVPFYSMRLVAGRLWPTSCVTGRWRTGGPQPFWSQSPERSSTRTAPASCTVISSHETSCWRFVVRRFIAVLQLQAPINRLTTNPSSPTSAWSSGSLRRAAA